MQRFPSISWNRVLLNTFCILSGIAIGFVILAIAGSIEVKESWPAWVRAIGSIAAIGVAVAIPAEEVARRNRAEADEKRIRIARAAAILHPTLEELNRLLFNFVEAFGEDAVTDEQLNFYAVDSEFEKITPSLVSILVANEDLGDLGPDVYKLTVALSSYDAWIKRILDVMEIGYNNHMMRTELPTRVERAREMLVMTKRVMGQIDSGAY